MKHSCKPNVVTRDESCTIKIIAVESIKAGDALTFYYTRDELLLCPTIIRRQHLHRIKQFWCHCELCESDDLTSPLKCPTKGCDAYIYLSIKRFTDDLSKGWMCRKCLSEFTGCQSDESNKHNVMPIIRHEFDLSKQYLEMYFRQYPNDVSLPCSSLIEAEQRADVIKSKVGERHSLHMLMYKSYLAGIDVKTRDGIAAVLHSYLICAKWIATTFNDNDRRKYIGLANIVKSLSVLLTDKLSKKSK
eukprot:gene19524-25421_t